jgi:hypothetical protein
LSTTSRVAIGYGRRSGKLYAPNSCSWSQPMILSNSSWDGAA